MYINYDVEFVEELQIDEPVNFSVESWRTFLNDEFISSVLQLKYEEDKKVEEIVEILNSSVNKVKKALVKGRRLLEIKYRNVA